MTDSAPKRTCPNCGKEDVESAGVVAAFYPRRLTEEADRHRGRKVIEAKFRCRACGHQFSETETIDF